MKFLAIIAFLLLTATAIAAPAPDTLSNPAQEARARMLQRDLRCLVCQGESLDESSAPLAADLRRLIRERIGAGDSDEQIKRFLVTRYGDFILLKPPFEPTTYALWLTPFLVLIAGAGVTILVVIRARRRSEREIQR